MLKVKGDITMYTLEYYQPYPYNDVIKTDRFENIIQVRDRTLYSFDNIVSLSHGSGDEETKACGHWEVRANIQSELTKIFPVLENEANASIQNYIKKVHMQACESCKMSDDTTRISAYEYNGDVMLLFEGTESAPSYFDSGKEREYGIWFSKYLDVEKRIQYRIENNFSKHFPNMEICWLYNCTWHMPQYYEKGEISIKGRNEIFRIETCRSD